MVRDPVAEIFACCGIPAVEHTKTFRGIAGLRALDTAARVTAARPDDLLVTVTRHEFRSSALTLIQTLGSPIMIRTHPVGGRGAAGSPQPTDQSQTVHCVLSGPTGDDGAFDPATMAVSWLFDSASEFDWAIDEARHRWW